MSEETQKRMKLQSDEFAAVAVLGRRYSALPAVVDDDYPEARHHYESAMRDLITAIAANGRIPNLSTELERNQGSQLTIADNALAHALQMLELARKMFSPYPQEARKLSIAITDTEAALLRVQSVRPNSFG